MSKPAHSKAHDELSEIIARVSDSSGTIEGWILITVGKDMRPAISSNVGDAAGISSILRQLGNAEDKIASVEEKTLSSNQ